MSERFEDRNGTEGLVDSEANFDRVLETPKVNRGEPRVEHLDDSRIAEQLREHLSQIGLLIKTYPASFGISADCSPSGLLDTPATKPS